MDSRERIKAIFSGQKPDRCGFWLGMPSGDTWPIYLKHFGVPDGEHLRQMLGDDIRWSCPEWAGCYKRPDGKPIIFDSFKVAPSGSPIPVFSGCTDLSDIDNYAWPDPDYLDFSESILEMTNAGSHYRASGMFCCFFHVVAGLFGMENYFVLMHTAPEIVDEVTRRVCEFYLKANEQFFEAAGKEVDAFFFGNDFGTQLDLLISPASFNRFILPWVRRFIDQGHEHGYQVMVHSCGAIHKITGSLIEAGIDALHPLQAKASNMDAGTLARDFKGKVAFVGGIDTQDLLVNGTPDQVRDEVRRVKRLLGPNLVISPSHETLLPNVAPENVLAMAEAARESELERVI